ncbi:MAG: BspA family leucine-rich repeat surface protein [Prevotella sp.]|nr:BspA family leucine-rich repeat surface protein [Prevotella sp.]
MKRLLSVLLVMIAVLLPTKSWAADGVSEAYAVLSEDNTVLTFYYDDQKATRNGMSVGPFTYEAARGWNDYMQSITTVTFDDTFVNCASISSTQQWFSGCLNLTTINGLNNLNTENVTTMNSMFADCRKLTNLDLSHFKTSNVTSMWAMFNNCLSLTELDMSNFNTENVNDTYAMFAGCSALTTIYVGSEWNTSKMSADYSRNMFADCLKLVGGAGTVFDANHVDYTYAHIDGGTANPGYFTDKNATPAVVEPYAVLNDNNTVLTFYYDDQKEARSGMSVGPFTDYGQNGWRSLNVTKVVFDQTFANCRPTSTAFWFDGLYYLNEIEGIENLNTDNVTDMRSMFEACSSLTSIDFSHFNTENVTSFDHMFWNCTSLTNLDLSRFNTQKVTSTYWMFALCNRLTSVNLNGFNTSSMETMEGMFYDCASLAAIQAGSAAIPDSIYAQVNNPNLLVYVNESSLAPSNVQNVVVNGTAREIVLTDVTSGNNNFYVPQTFTAERISYTRNFTQSTQVGVSRGWESIALPFDVQTITHETKGTIAPFGNTASNRHFWLRELGGNGLQSATGIAANTPYVISMPNSSDYTDNNNLAGQVTFAAENATIPVTEVKASAMADQSIVMIPTMQRQERSSEVWALNVGEVRGRYLEGSVFERDYREVRPFEAYTVHRQENTQPAPRYVPLQEIGGTTGINVMEDVRSKKDDVWYTTDGRKLQGKPSEKGVYINNGQKIVIR